MLSMLSATIPLDHASSEVHLPVVENFPASDRFLNTVYSGLQRGKEVRG